MAEKWLKMRVKIYFLINRIFVAMESCAVCHIRIFKLQRDSVHLIALKIVSWQVQLMLSELNVLSKYLIFIDLQICDAFALEIDVKLIQSFIAKEKIDGHLAFKVPAFC